MGNCLGQLLQKKGDDGIALNWYSKLEEGRSAAEGNAVGRAVYEPFTPLGLAILNRKDDRSVFFETTPVRYATVPAKEHLLYKKLHQTTNKYGTRLNDLDFELDVTRKKTPSSPLHYSQKEGRSGKKGKEKETVDIAKQLCWICLSEEQKWTIQGILNCCSHYFCFSCIMEWFKVESRCPLCKRRFFTITKCCRSDPMLEIRRPVIRVQMRDQSGLCTRR